MDHTITLDTYETLLILQLLRSHNKREERLLATTTDQDLIDSLKVLIAHNAETITKFEQDLR